MTLILNPDIFKAYDVRGVYPSEINEDAARAIGTAFSAYLQAKRIAGGRAMRLSSPALGAAFLAGAPSQGTDEGRMSRPTAIRFAWRYGLKAVPMARAA